MSIILEYFPPSATKYTWHHKTLNYSPWCCDLSHQMSGAPYSSDLWPMSVRLSVDKKPEHFVWRVDVCRWDGTRHTLEGTSITDIEACLAAEAAGETAYVELMPDWIVTALKHGWRPPSR